MNEDLFESLHKGIADMGLGKTEKDYDSLSVSFSPKGDGFPDYMVLRLDSDRDFISLFSAAELGAEGEARKNIAVAVSLLNHKLSGCCFDYDMSDDSLYLRLTHNAEIGGISDNMLRYMVAKSIRTVQRYRPVLLSIASGGTVQSVYDKLAKKPGSKAIAPDNSGSAAEAYRRLCSVAERLGWRYKRDEDNLRLNFDILGEDVPMSFETSVSPDDKLVLIKSPLPFVSRASKSDNAVVASCAATNLLADGCFAYDRSDSRIIYKMSASYRDSMIDEAVLTYMISCALTTVEKFNDKFMALNKNLISLKDFLKNIG